MFDVEVRKIDAIRVAGMRHVGPYEGIGDVFARLGAWAGPKGLFRPSTRMIGVFHDDPGMTPARELRSDACITVDDSFSGDADAGVEVSVIPAGEYAVGTLKGSYRRMHEAYAFLQDTALPSLARKEADRACFEVYLNNPGNTPEDELLTEIHVPLV